MGGIRASKSKKGTIVISSDRGMLRLRWRLDGVRYTLSLGLADTPLNQVVAKQTSLQIEMDIHSGVFDSSLNKYRVQSAATNGEKREELTVTQLIERYIKDRSKYVSDNTVSKYRGVLVLLRSYFSQDKRARQLTKKEVDKFIGWYQKQDGSNTTKHDRLVVIRAMWKWAVDNKHVLINPWENAPLQIRNAPKMPPKPFSKDETKQIIESIRNNCYYSYLADYFTFLFGTGVRTGEAIGLRWKHLSDDCSQVWVGETIVRGKRGTTKTNKARTIRLSPQMQQMLQRRKNQALNATPESLVFPALEGGCLNDTNIRNRTWKPTLERLGIPYRKPYATRSTYISHQLLKGKNPLLVAQYAGHNVKVLYEHYAGYIHSDEPMEDYF
jgi:integrase